MKIIFQQAETGKTNTTLPRIKICFSPASLFYHKKCLRNAVFIIALVTTLLIYLKKN
jgi:hypothetical protein